MALSEETEKTIEVLRSKTNIPIKDVILYNDLMEGIQQRMEAELFAAGLTRAKTTEAEAEHELSLARDSLNQKAEAQAQNNLKRVRIEKKYTDEKKEIKKRLTE